MNVDVPSAIIFIIRLKMISTRCSGAFALAFVILAFGIAGSDARAPKRIIGGGNAAAGEIPWQVSLRVSGAHRCGGSIIGRRHILTAAHCVDGVDPSEITVVTGTNSLESGSGQTSNVKSVTVHKNYVERTSFTPAQNDIAVIALTEEIEENEYQKVIELATGEVPTRVRAVVSGYGETDRNGKVSPLLQKLNVILLGKSQCASSGIYIERYQLCALKALRSGTCKGDGGSPLVYDRVLVGIVSTPPIHCGIGIPDVYTRVDYYKDFIAESVAST